MRGRIAARGYGPIRCSPCVPTRAFSTACMCLKVSSRHPKPIRLWSRFTVQAEVRRPTATPGRPLPMSIAGWCLRRCFPSACSVTATPMGTSTCSRERSATIAFCCRWSMSFPSSSGGRLHAFRWQAFRAVATSCTASSTCIRTASRHSRWALRGASRGSTTRATSGWERAT